MTATTDLLRTQLASPVGELTLVASGEGLRAVLWPDEPSARARHAEGAAPAERGHHGAGGATAELPAEARDSGASTPADGPGQGPGPARGRAAGHLTGAEEQITAWLAGDRDSLDLPLDPRGTDFQLAVWDALRDVPHGTTTTYGQLAVAVGRPSAARAVGAAVGANPLSIVVPCHRVIGRDGSLTGYAGGLDAKRWLLTREGVGL